MSEIKDILREHDFRFNKQFGQNFILDQNLLDAMVVDAGITADDTVIEVGPGAGTLTRALAKVARRVVAFEIDNNLREILPITLADYADKVEVIFKDFQRVTPEELEDILGGGSYKVVANLPYYITTPLVMNFLEAEHKPVSITVMVQKEVAERFVSRENTAEYGIVTVAIDMEGDASITRIVPRNMFYPMPNVDSAVVRIDVRDKGIAHKAEVKRLVKASFSMRRKTLVNNLTQNFGADKAKVLSALETMDKDVRVRGEVLSTDEFVRLYELLTK